MTFLWENDSLLHNGKYKKKVWLFFFRESEFASRLIEPLPKNVNLARNLQMFLKKPGVTVTSQITERFLSFLYEFDRTLEKILELSQFHD